MILNLSGTQRAVSEVAPKLLWVLLSLAIALLAPSDGQAGSATEFIDIQATGSFQECIYQYFSNGFSACGSYPAPLLLYPNIPPVTGSIDVRFSYTPAPLTQLYTNAPLSFQSASINNQAVTALLTKTRPVLTGTIVPGYPSNQSYLYTTPIYGSPVAYGGTANSILYSDPARIQDALRTNYTGESSFSAGFATSAITINPDGTIRGNQFTGNSTYNASVSVINYISYSLTPAEEQKYQFDFGGGFGNYAYLNGFINKVSVAAPQQVYLDFGQDPNAVFRLDTALGNFAQVYNKPAAGFGGASLSQQQIDSIVATDNNIYSKYFVNFTATKPLSGPYDTIFVGGTQASIPYLNGNPIANNLAGLAESVNVFDSNPSESAVVLSGKSFFYNNGQLNSSLLSQVIAHEAGHLFGLSHVTPSTSLMYPLGNASATSISNHEPLATTLNGQVLKLGVGLFQNSDGDLLCGLGSASNGMKDCGGADAFKTLNLSTNSLFSSIYDARLIFPGTASDADVGPITISLGTLTGNGTESINVPLFLYLQKAILEGSSTESGPVNIFGGTSTPFIGSLTDPKTFESILFAQNGALAFNNMTFWELQGSSFVSFGGAGLTLTGGGGSLSSTPLPASWQIMLIGIGVFGCITYFAQRSRQQLYAV